MLENSLSPAEVFQMADVVRAALAQLGKDGLINDDTTVAELVEVLNACTTWAARHDLTVREVVELRET